MEKLTEQIIVIIIGAICMYSIYTSNIELAGVALGGIAGYLTKGYVSEKDE